MEKKKIFVPIEISARHIHLCQPDLVFLFGKRYQLRKLRNLPRTCQFAAKETLDIQSGKKKLLGIRIVGPLRKYSQVELSLADARLLGINPPLRDSEDHKGTPGIVLIGPKNQLKLKQGVINAWRHIHCNFREAKKIGLKNGMLISVKTEGISSVTFNNVKVSVEKNCSLCLHLDTDEGNAAGIIKRGKGEIIK